MSLVWKVRTCTTMVFWDNFWLEGVWVSFRGFLLVCQLANSVSTYKQEVSRLVSTQISKTHMFYLVTCFWSKASKHGFKVKYKDCRGDESFKHTCSNCVECVCAERTNARLNANWLCIKLAFLKWQCCLSSQNGIKFVQCIECLD